MPIHYALFENNVTADPDDYAASVQITDTADLDTLIHRMIERGSTTTRADILAVMEDAIGACESMLLDGMRGLRFRISDCGFGDEDTKVTKDWHLRIRNPKSPIRNRTARARLCGGAESR